MKKKFGITLGGLQQKIFNLVLIFILAVVALFAAVSIYQSKQLNKIVSDASEKQQNSINQISQDTMEQVVKSTMTTSTRQQAYMANEMFSEVKGSVLTLKALAESMFTNRGVIVKDSVSLPDKTKDGQVSAQLLYDEGVDPSKSEDIGIASRMTDVMMSMFKNSDQLNSCFIALEDGTFLIVDDKPSNKFDENGKLLTFPARQRPWYTASVAKGDVYFTGAEKDTFTGRIEIVCAAPVYSNGKLIGVVGADMFLDSMAEYVENSSQKGGFVCVVNDKGQVIFSPNKEGSFTVKTSDQAADLRSSDNKELAGFVTDSLKANTDVCKFNIDDTEYYLCGSPINNVGWTVVSGISSDLIRQPTDKMLEEYKKVNKDASDAFESGAKKSETTTLVMIIVLLLLGTVCSLYMATRIVKPVEHMTKRIAEIGGSDLQFKMEDIYKTKDEIEVLAEAFATLSKRTLDYIQEITTITKEKERIGTELALATKIQADMLPSLFPAFPDRPEIDIYATMTPAKEVGGDFYDFFLIDDDHLAMIMADVSGKGIPAALFMMMSKILVNNYAMMGNSPAKVLELTNATICEHNDEEMFVTLWLGILEISTGKVVAANAGHEYPMIKREGKGFEVFKDKHGFVIGGMEGVKYKEYEFTLGKNETLFLYTDGVAEATNKDNVLFGTERMLNALNKESDARPDVLLKNMKQSIDEFVGETDQFDDLTMLAVTLL